MTFISISFEIIILELIKFCKLPIPNFLLIYCSLGHIRNAISELTSVKNKLQISVLVVDQVLTLEEHSTKNLIPC